jgi:Flp pilus assembly protein TadG
MRRLHKNEQGAAVVEFAVLFGLLLIFLAGIFEFGFLWIESNYIASAAREGARVAAKVSGTNDTAITERESVAEAAVEQYLKSSFLFKRIYDDPQFNAKYSDFTTTTYTRDPDNSNKDKTMTVTINGANTDIYMAEVTVTVKTEYIWSPLLWPLLSAIIPGVSYSPDKLKQLSQSASFVIENYN